MEIVPFKKDYLPEMAGLFTGNFKKLRAAVPALPDTMESAGHVADMLAGLFDICPGLVALEKGQLVGYMGWYIGEHFRGTDRKGSYCPEWGHSAAEGMKAKVYRALYGAAAEIWFEGGCDLHALTLLTHDREAENVWFWNGFGLTVVDAIRSIEPLNKPAPSGVVIRKATPDDVPALAIMEVEHAGYYRQPPILMMAYDPVDASALTESMETAKNSIWVALDGDQYMGYARFDTSGEESIPIVHASDQVANTGAFVRPQYRGRGIAPAMLDAALRDYASQGFQRCSVDFESFNPQAAVFWPKYFEPVGFSVVRVPERRP